MHKTELWFMLKFNSAVMKYRGECEKGRTMKSCPDLIFSLYLFSVPLHFHLRSS